MSAIEDALAKLNQQSNELSKLSNNIKTGVDVDAGNISSHMSTLNNELRNYSNQLTKSQSDVLNFTNNISSQIVQSLNNISSSGNDISNILPQLDSIASKLKEISNDSSHLSFTDTDSTQQTINTLKEIVANLSSMHTELSRLGNSPHVDDFRNQLSSFSSEMKDVIVSIQATSQAFKDLDNQQKTVSLNLKALEEQFNIATGSSKSLEDSIKSLFTSMDGRHHSVFEDINNKISSLQNDVSAIQANSQNISTPQQISGIQQQINRYNEHISSIRQQTESIGEDMSSASLGDIQTLYSSLEAMNNSAKRMSSSLLISIKNLSAPSSVKSALEAEVNRSIQESNQSASSFANTLTQMFTKRLDDINNNIDKGHQDILNDMSNGRGLGSSFSSNVSQTGQASTKIWQDITTAEYLADKSYNPFTRSSAHLNDMKKSSQKISQMNYEYEQGSQELANLYEQADKAGKAGDNEARNALLKRAKNRYRSLIELQKKINSQTISLGKNWKLLSNSDKQRLGEEGKRIEQNLQQLFKRARQGSNNLVATKEAFHIEGEDESLEELKKVTSSMNELGESFEELNKPSIFDEMLKSANGIIDTLLGIGRQITSFLGKFGIATSLLGALGSAEYMYSSYGEQHRQRYKSMGLDAYMGVNDLQASASRAYGRMLYGNSLYRASGGMISQYAVQESYQSLRRNVGARFGDDAEQVSQDMDKIASELALFQNVYGVDQQTINDTIKMYYKDMRMSADEATTAFAKLAQTAQSAGIPMNQYLRTITALAERYMSVGLTGEDAENVLNNLSRRGMRIEVSQELAEQLSGAMSNFANNKGQVGFFAAMNGEDPWHAIAQAAYTHDSKGDPRKGWGREIAKGMDTMFSMYMPLYGNNPDLRRMGATDTFRRMGFSQRSASILASTYLETGNTEQFQELLEKKASELDNPNATMEEINEEIYGKLTRMKGQLSMSDVEEARAKSKLFEEAEAIGIKIDSIISIFGPLLKKFQEIMIDTMAVVAEFIANGVQSDEFQKAMNVITPIVKQLPKIIIGALAVKTGLDIASAGIDTISSLFTPGGLIKAGALAAGGYLLYDSYQRYKEETEGTNEQPEKKEDSTALKRLKQHLSEAKELASESAGKAKELIGYVDDRTKLSKRIAESEVMQGISSGIDKLQAKAKEAYAKTEIPSIPSIPSYGDITNSLQTIAKNNISLENERSYNAKLSARISDLTESFLAEGDSEKRSKLGEAIESLQKRLTESDEKIAALEEEGNQSTAQLEKVSQQSADDSMSATLARDTEIADEYESQQTSIQEDSSTQHNATTQSGEESSTKSQEQSSKKVDAGEKIYKDKNTGLVSESEGQSNSILSMLSGILSKLGIDNPKKGIDTKKSPLFQKTPFFQNPSAGSSNKAQNEIPNETLNGTSNLPFSISPYFSGGTQNKDPFSLLDNPQITEKTWQVTRNMRESLTGNDEITNQITGSNVQTVISDNDKLSTRSSANKSREREQNKFAGSVNTEQAREHELSIERNTKLDIFAREHERLMGLFQASVTEDHENLMKMTRITQRILVDMKSVFGRSMAAMAQGLSRRSGFTDGGGDYKITGDSGITAEKLNELFKGGVLEGKGEAFIRIAKKHGIDPAFMAAITKAENNYGKDMSGILGHGDPNNVFSWTQGTFNSVEENIERAAYELKHFYVDQGEDTVRKIQPYYAPIGAANDPTELNKNWTSNILRALREDMGISIPSSGPSGQGGMVGNIPVLAQERDDDCTYTAIAMVMNAYGKNVSVSDMHNRYSSVHIANTLTENGIDTELIEYVNTDQLTEALNQGKPVILYYEGAELNEINQGRGTHAVVLAGFNSDGTVKVLDPNKGQTWDKSIDYLLNGGGDEIHAAIPVNSAGAVGQVFQSSAGTNIDIGPIDPSAFTVGESSVDDYYRNSPYHMAFHEAYQIRTDGHVYNSILEERQANEAREASETREDNLAKGIAPNGERFKEEDVKAAMSTGISKQEAYQQLANHPEYLLKDAELLQYYGIDISSVSEDKQVALANKLAGNIKAGKGPNGRQISENDMNYLLKQGYDKDAAKAMLFADDKYKYDPLKGDASFWLTDKIIGKSGLTSISKLTPSGQHVFHGIDSEDAINALYADSPSVPGILSTSNTPSTSSNTSTYKAPRAIGIDVSRIQQVAKTVEKSVEKSAKKSVKKSSMSMPASMSAAADAIESMFKSNIPCITGNWGLDRLNHLGFGKIASIEHIAREMTDKIPDKIHDKIPNISKLPEIKPAEILNRELGELLNKADTMITNAEKNIDIEQLEEVGQDLVDKVHEAHIHLGVELDESKKSDINDMVEKIKTLIPDESIDPEEYERVKQTLLGLYQSLNDLMSIKNRFPIAS